MSTTRIEVFSGDAPENALELAAWLQAKLAEVPEEYRASAKVSTSSDYDGESWLTISYERPATPEEIARRSRGGMPNEFATRFFEANVRQMNVRRALTKPIDL